MTESWRWQLRDRGGRWIEMGAEVTWMERGARRSGRVVGSPRPGVATVESQQGIFGKGRREDVPSSYLMVVPGSEPAVVPEGLPWVSRAAGHAEIRQTMTSTIERLVASGTLPGGMHEYRVRTQGDPATSATLQIEGPGGVLIRVRRVIMQPAPGGRVRAVEHEHLMIDPPSLQGRGIAAAINADLEEVYRRRGISEIHLLANVDVGGYAWARAGYDWEDQKSAQFWLRSMRKQTLTRPGPGPERDAVLAELAMLQRQFDAGIPPTPIELAMIGRTYRTQHPTDRRRDMWFGKQFMLMGGWRGVRRISGTTFEGDVAATSAQGGALLAGGESWRWQLRDRRGRWIEMGAEVKWLAKGRWRFGSVVGSPSPGMAEVEEYQTLRKQVIATSRLEVVEEAERILDEVEVHRDAKGRINWRRTNLSKDVIAERIERARLAPEPEPEPVEPSLPPVVWDASAAEYTVSYPRGTGEGVVEARVPGEENPIGVLRWNYLEEPPVVVDVSVDERYRRQGVATRLFNLAQEKESQLQHSDTLTPEGRAFRDAVERIERPRLAPEPEPVPEPGPEPVPEPEPEPEPDLDTSHRGSHQPPDDSVTLDNLADPTVGTFPDDVYDHPEWYMHTSNASERYERDSLAVVRRVRGKPDAKVAVYRAVPDSAPDRINPGDWVTLSRAYAEQHAEDEGWKIITAEVTAREVRSGGNDLIEWGYWGEQSVGPSASRNPMPEPVPEPEPEPVPEPEPEPVRPPLPLIPGGSWQGFDPVALGNVFKAEVEREVTRVVKDRYPEAVVRATDTHSGITLTVHSSSSPDISVGLPLLKLDQRVLREWDDNARREDLIVSSFTTMAGDTPVDMDLIKAVQARLSDLYAKRSVDVVRLRGGTPEATAWMLRNGYTSDTGNSARYDTEKVLEDVIRGADADQAAKARRMLDDFYAKPEGEEVPIPLEELINDFGIDAVSASLRMSTLVKRNPRDEEINDMQPTIESLDPTVHPWSGVKAAQQEITGTVIAVVRDQVKRGMLPGKDSDYTFRVREGEVDITGPEGVRIIVNRNLRTTKSVENAYFKVDPEHQGLGIGTEINNALLDLYRRRSVREMYLLANIDVGGYAWARAGYDFVLPAKGEWFVDRALNEFFTERGNRRRTGAWAKDPAAKEIIAEIKALKDGRQPVTPLQLAMLGYAHRRTITRTIPPGTSPPPGWKQVGPDTVETETWFGKQLMLRSVWDGVKRIEPLRPMTAGGESWRWQLRDRRGRWIEMGAEVKWLAKGRWRFGSVVGSPSPGMAEVEEYQTLRKQVIATSRLEVVEEAERILDEVEVHRDAKGRIDWRRTNLSSDVIAARIARARSGQHKAVLPPEPKPPEPSRLLPEIPAGTWQRIDISDVRRMYWADVEREVRAVVEAKYPDAVIYVEHHRAWLDIRVQESSAPDSRELLVLEQIIEDTGDQREELTVSLATPLLSTGSADADLAMDVYSRLDELFALRSVDEVKALGGTPEATKWLLDRGYTSLDTVQALRNTKSVLEAVIFNDPSLERQDRARHLLDDLRSVPEEQRTPIPIPDLVAEFGQDTVATALSQRMLVKRNQRRDDVNAGLPTLDSLDRSTYDWLDSPSAAKEISNTVVATVRDLVKRGVLTGSDGDYTFSVDNGVSNTSSVTITGPENFRMVITRTFNPRKSSVYNAYFKIDGKHQGQGIGATINDALDELYRRRGVKQMTLLANIDVGGYAWARRGYDFENPDQGASTAKAALAELVTHAGNKQRVRVGAPFARANKWLQDPSIDDLIAEVKALSERAPSQRPTPLELAMLGYDHRRKSTRKLPGGIEIEEETWFGKEFMLGRSWKGVKKLEPPLAASPSPARGVPTSAPVEPASESSSVTAAGGESWRWQLRDRRGRWIEMGAEVKWLMRGRYRHGIIVGSPRPGVATVEEAWTAIRRDIPAARLEVVAAAAELVDRIEKERDVKGRVDWSKLNLTAEQTKPNPDIPRPKVKAGLTFASDLRAMDAFRVPDSDDKYTITSMSTRVQDGRVELEAINLRTGGKATFGMSPTHTVMVVDPDYDMQRDVVSPVIKAVAELHEKYPQGFEAALREAGMESAPPEPKTPEGYLSAMHKANLSRIARVTELKVSLQHASDEEAPFVRQQLADAALALTYDDLVYLDMDESFRREHDIWDRKMRRLKFLGTRPEVQAILEDVMAVGRTAREGLGRDTYMGSIGQLAVEYGSGNWGRILPKARRDAARTLVATVRGRADGTKQTWQDANHGDDAVASHVRALTDAEKAMVSDSLLLFPRTWVEKFDEYDVTTEVATRGSNNTYSVTKRAHIRLADYSGRGPVDGGTMQSVTVHEIGHTMETVIPGLALMENAFWHRRVGSTDIALIRDDYALFPERPMRPTPMRYTLKSYYDDPEDPDQKSWEVFTTGVQEVLGDGESQYTMQAKYLSETGKYGEPDTELYDLTLGMLLTM